MGAWGTALFSDDTACDVRDDYVALLENNISDEVARQRVLGEQLTGEANIDAVVWLALAATQSKFGRLDDGTKSKALQIIDNGEGLELWEEQGPKVLIRRKEVLATLRDVLAGTQPNRKTMVREQRHVTSLITGDVLSFQTNGRVYLFLVNEIDEGKTETAPVLDALEWTGAKLPTHWRIRQLAHKQDALVYRGIYEGPEWMPRRLRVHSSAGIDFVDIGFSVVRNVRLRTGAHHTCPHGRSNWEDFAEQLKSYAAN